MGPEEVHVEAEGLGALLPVDGVLAQLLDGTIGQEALEGGLLGLVEAGGDDVPVAVAGELAAPQVVSLDRREVVPLQPGHVLLVAHGVLGSPVGAVVHAELVGQVGTAVVLADDADVVPVIAQGLRVGPRAQGDGGLVGDVPLGVGQDLVLAWKLAGQQGGARRGADGRGGEAVGEGEAGLAHGVDDRGLGVRVAQAADGVGAVLVGHDDQDVADVVGNVPCGTFRLSGLGRLGGGGGLAGFGGRRRRHESSFLSSWSVATAGVTWRRPCRRPRAGYRWSRGGSGR